MCKIYLLPLELVCIEWKLDFLVHIKVESFWDSFFGPILSEPILPNQQVRPWEVLLSTTKKNSQKQNIPINQILYIYP